MRHSRLWWLWLTVGTLATGSYYLLPEGGMGRNIVYNVIGLASALGIVLAIRLHRPPHPAMWYWFAAAEAVWVVGDIVYEYYQYTEVEAPYPSAADAFYLSAYPMILFALHRMSRDNGRRDLAGLVDATILATGLGLVFWVAMMEPVASDSTAPMLERLVSVAYPAVDVLLLALLARLAFGMAAWTPTMRLLAVGVVLLLIADTGYSLLDLYTDSDGTLLDAAFMLSYVTWGAAALHPSMFPRVAVAQVESRMTAGRILLLATSSLLGPALLLVPRIGGNVNDRTAIGIGAIVLFLLVLLRMSGFVGQVQRQARQLTDMAMRDDLTGLANRRRFERDLGKALHRGGRPVVALLGLTGFKSVNDQLGHAVGDQLLVAVGRRLSTGMDDRAQVARMGGDEFAILIDDATPDSAAAVVDAITAALHDAFRVGGHELLVNGSVGMADATGATDAMELVRRADIAMYAAKTSGETCRWYATELDQQAGEEARLGAELRTALDSGQFRLVYQPIVELPHGRIKAVETLVRWDHPERGFISPVDFIPVAERNGLIMELGAWILREACHQASRWYAELGDVAPEHISVNASARQLAHRGFAALVASALEDSGLSATRLTIEVTETAVFEGGPAVDTLHRLHDLGVRIALDDFGTGHSSLGLLQTVPVDVLKVDKSFVDTITMAGRHAVIATALIQVADGLGLTAVAEGVETAEQAAELERLGYRLAQGYYFGIPEAQPDFRRNRESAVDPAAI
ncbi:putative bifunctional diguanylate cyclase/phosphodiesterase [Couchioplanes caeruleus]|uniref:Diguanylate cyclase n=2 Tax=Couchioplanes caeruleus TaxID=56438 RepID=A0A1K0GKZ0_9ACTN|nr:bifunctional diguanylate cyclase/phosphodiesterase [Couchioplanes caeruleus]OJF09859.1 diguanylate cyclase [Couchioplanes caeruleus subsp. caeruleus]ROP29025.1 diguanylate cyclase (GGDEF)-like protein [Couchioplanes caeruleus]